MVNSQLVLYVFAFVFFIVAAIPNRTNLRWEWFGFAAIVLAQIL